MARRPLRAVASLQELVVLRRRVSATALQVGQESMPQRLPALRQATLHRLRHTCAIDLFQAGADPRHVQENLDHASMDTTLIYNDNDKASRHDDTEKLGNDNATEV